MTFTPKDEQTLFLITKAIEHRYFRLETVRKLAGSEEKYRKIMREIDRVKAQLIRARACNAEATLTIMEWFTILDHFHWMCSYCQAKPFQIMNHVSPQQEKGTTAENCVPACHSCVARLHKKIST